MTVSFKFPLLLCSILIGFTALAQNVRLTDEVIEKQSKRPVISANVMLLSPEGDFYKGATTDENGNFQLSVQPGNYELQISFIGYDPISIPLQPESDTNLGVLEIFEKADELGEIEIVLKTPPVVQKGDTTVFNSSSYKTNPDANAMQLLEKMPGIVMQNGKLQAQCEDVKKVLVDGKPFFALDPYYI